MSNRVELVRPFVMQGTRTPFGNYVNRIRGVMLTQDLRNPRGSIIIRNDLIPGGRTNLSRNNAHLKN